MARNWASGNGDASLFVDAGGRHVLVDPLTREAYFFLMEQMLHAHLRTRAPMPPSRALLGHVRGNLRLAGNDLRELGGPGARTCGQGAGVSRRAARGAP